MTDILLVEDHEELNQLLCSFLERGSFRTKGVFSGEEAVGFLQREKVRLVILDVSLSGQMDGFAVCRAIRETSGIPILFLSARVGKEDKMNGYMLGADDYMEKPVDMDILLAKVAALMHRNYDLKEKNEIISSGALTIDKEAQQVFLNQKEIRLNVKEFELLCLLVLNPGKALSKDFLFHKIWGAYSESENQTLTVHIKMLRDKIEDDPKHPKRIRTVWGVGYKYEEN